MENQFTEVCIKLGNIPEKIDILEQQQKSLQNEMKSSTSVLSSNSASTHDIKPRIRDRLTSTSLMLNKYYVQVCEYNLYLNSLYSTVRYDVFILCLMKKIS